MVSAIELEVEVSVLVFQRAQVKIVMFNSAEYHRTKSRCSYNVCFQHKRNAPTTK